MLPAEGASFTVRRDPAEDRSARIEWPPAEGARGHIVRFGIAPDKPYANHQVGDDAELTVQSLNAGVTYFSAIDSFNERGATAGRSTVRVPTGRSDF